MENYLPDGAKAGHLAQFLSANPNVEFFRFQWVDLSGVLRARVVTRAHCCHLESSDDRLSLVGASMMVLIDNTTVPNEQTIGLDELHPDWSSLRSCVYSPTYATLMCFVRHNRDRFDRCPRYLLASKLESTSVDLLIGLEIEFAIFDETDHLPETIQMTPAWSAVVSLRNRYLSLLEEVVRLLQRSDIPVQHFHSEGFGKGTFEISLGPQPPMRAVDNFVYAHDLIKSVCQSRSLIASMIPKPFKHDDVYIPNRSTTQGLHAHISVAPDEGEQGFLAGILSCLPGLCAFGMPSFDSYIRVRDGIHEAAGQWVGWGTQNRDMPVRKICSGHWELRFIDVTANLYLTLAMVIAAGLSGLLARQKLKWSDCQSNPNELIKPRREELGMTTLLPKSLEEALQALRSDQTLSSLLPKDLFDSYVAVKVTENHIMARLGEEQRRLVSMTLF